MYKIFKNWKECRMCLMTKIELDVPVPGFRRPHNFPFDEGAPSLAPEVLVASIGPPYDSGMTREITFFWMGNFFPRGNSTSPL